MTALVMAVNMVPGRRYTGTDDGPDETRGKGFLFVGSVEFMPDDPDTDLTLLSVALVLDGETEVSVVACAHGDAMIPDAPVVPTPETHALAAVILVVALPWDDYENALDPAEERIKAVTEAAGVPVVGTASLYTVENVEDFVALPEPWEA